MVKGVVASVLFRDPIRRSRRCHRRQSGKRFEGETKEAVMTISKDIRFPVSVHWQGQQLVHVEAPDVDEIVVAVPPEFRGPGGHWSAEQLLVGAAASCYAVTFAALAGRRELPIHALTVTGTGHVGRRDDGRIGFIAVELTPRIRTEPEFVAAAERTARTAQTVCMVTTALDVPTHVVPVVSAVEPALT
jgi:organic hydroperoxide reductase OsmC/OhrA